MLKLNIWKGKQAGIVFFNDTTMKMVNEKQLKLKERDKVSVHLILDLLKSLLKEILGLEWNTIFWVKKLSGQQNKLTQKFSVTGQNMTWPDLSRAIMSWSEKPALIWPENLQLHTESFQILDHVRPFHWLEKDEESKMKPSLDLHISCIL